MLDVALMYRYCLSEVIQPTSIDLRPNPFHFIYSTLT